MQIYVTMNLAAGDELAMTSQDAAEAVLAALGGDPEKDSCTVQTSATAVAGVVLIPGAP